MVNPQKSLKIIRASAGSGKTYRLTLEYLKLLFSGKKRFKKALAVTFTNKATGEMRNRIMSSLRQLADQDVENPEFFKELSAEFSELDIQKEACKIYSDILHAYNYFSVVTIDKFVQKVVRSFAYELKLNTGYTIELNMTKVSADLMSRFQQRLDTDSALYKLIEEHVMREMENDKSFSYQKSLLEFVSKNLNEHFFDFDKAIRSHPDGKALLEDMSTAIEHNIASFEDGLKNCLNNLQDEYRSLNVSCTVFKGGKNNFFAKIDKAIDFDDLPKYMERIINLVNTFENWHNKNKETEVQLYYDSLNPLLVEIDDFYTAGKAEYFTAKAIYKNFNYLRILTVFSELLEDYRKENDILLISDATLLLNSLTLEYAENPGFIWEKYGAQLENFLFDEFQDTSRKQWQNFKPLVENAMASQDDKKTRHLIVGDAKQSIYRWRNSDWELFQNDVVKDLGIERVSIESLDTNYRSREAILHFNNALYNKGVPLLQEKLNEVIQKEDQEYFESIWKKSGYDKIFKDVYKDVEQKVSPGKVGSGGIVELVEIPLTNNQHRNSRMVDGALEQMAERLYEWIDSKKYHPGDIAILVRSNKEAGQTIAYMDTFLAGKDESTRFQVVSGGTLLLEASPAVQIILQSIDMLLNESSKAGQATMNFFLYYLQIQREHEENMSELLDNSWLNMAGLPLSEINILPKELIDHRNELLALPLPELVERLIVLFRLGEIAGYIPYLMAFRDQIARFCTSGDLGALTFLDWWSELKEPSLPETTKSDVVRIVSIHKSKGLEFNVVMIPFAGWEFNGKVNADFWLDLSDTQYESLGTAPVNYAGKTLNKSSVRGQYFREMMLHYMDNLNLLYVATTRAKSHLYISYPGIGEKEPNTYLAGDLIRILHDDFVKDGLISSDSNKMTLVNKEDEKVIVGTNNSFWSFDKYPVANHLNVQLSRTSLDQMARITADKNTRFGAAVHEVLAKVKSINEIQPVIQQLVRDGWIRMTEEERVSNMAERALSNKELAALLAKPYKIYNEQEILMPSGVTFRPDKVLAGQDETIVIDYKFTGQQAESHKKQITGYRNVLEKMGYPNVRTFLFYGFADQLIEV